MAEESEGGEVSDQSGTDDADLRDAIACFASISDRAIKRTLLDLIRSIAAQEQASSSP